MRSIFITALGLFSLTSFAGDFVLAPAGLYYSYKEPTSAGAQSGVTATYYDIRLGYRLGERIYLGGIYSAMNRAIDGGGSITRTSYGASFAYVFESNFFLFFHFLASSEFKSGSSVTLQKGMGGQVDLGYLFSMGSDVRFGPQVTYRQFKYSESKSGSAAPTSVSLTHTEVLPFLVFAFFF